MKAAIVLTTINGGEIIENLCENLLIHGNGAKATLYAIPDRKTPDVFFRACSSARQKGLHIVSPTIEEQDAFLRTLPIHPPIPYNTDNRRNVGFLMAIRDRPDFFLSLDDDNFFCKEEDFLGIHASRLHQQTAQEPVTFCSTGFWNCCSLLEFEQKAIPLFPRGYPIRPRFLPQEVSFQSNPGLPTWINAGLWLEAPDVDAITWLCFGEQARGFSWAGRNHRLSLETWCPINTQNTAIHSALMPAYYYLPMSSPELEIPIDRYGDILSGYFALKVAKAMKATASFGAPVSKHLRNSHDYHRDYVYEMLMLSVMDELLDWLVPLQLSGDSSICLYQDLASKLQQQIPEFRGKSWTPGLKQHFMFMTDSMKKWISAVQFLSGKNPDQ